MITSRHHHPARRWLIAWLVLSTLAFAGCTSGPTTSRSTPSPTTSQVIVTGTGIHKIKHVIVIMQENRSFDSYFGTYPGADGIAMANGVPKACIPDPRTPGRCQRPYHDSSDLNAGGPHGQVAAA